jgi:hypothetical protein
MTNTLFPHRSSTKQLCNTLRDTPGQMSCIHKATMHRGDWQLALTGTVIPVVHDTALLYAHTRVKSLNLLL